MDIEGKVITADALHTLIKSATYVKKRGADYVFQVKGNQKNLLKWILTKFPEGEKINWSHIETEKGHGRIEVRRSKSYKIKTSDRQNMFFPYSKQIVCVERERTNVKTGEVTVERSYYITSLNSEIEEVSEFIRNHWHIENKIHYVRDVTFREDHSQVRTKSAPFVMTIFRNLAMGILRLLGYKNIAKGLRNFTRNMDLAINLLL